MSVGSEYSYMRSQEIFGAKKGDRVYIFRKARDHEAGWANTWDPNMDYAVGKEGKVISRNHGSSGILIRVDGIFDYFYPYFVLRLK